jgi:CheY-like chemotaxis protein
MSPIRPPGSVLIADPCPDNADSLAAVLAASGYRAVTAYTSAGAMARATADPPAVVITEAGFPDGDGFALAARLVNASWARPVLVLLTAHPGLAGRARAAGFDHHFDKPADLTELVSVVGRARPARSGGAVCTSS